jgi:hypothetical protein
MITNSGELVTQVEYAIENTQINRRIAASDIEKVDKNDHQGFKEKLLQMNLDVTDENYERWKNRANGKSPIPEGKEFDEERRLTALLDLTRVTNHKDAEYKTHAEAIEVAGLNVKPALFEASNGNVYGFAANKAYNGERAIVTDLTDEITKFNKLTEAEKQTYQNNPDKMKADFNNLSAIAEQYDGQTAFTIAASFKPALKPEDARIKEEQKRLEERREQSALDKGNLKSQFEEVNGEEFKIIAMPNMALSSLREVFGVKAQEGSSIIDFKLAQTGIIGTPAEPAPENVIELNRNWNNLLNPAV